MKLEALAFDTGGTVLDWPGGLVAQARRLGAARGVEVDWHAFVNAWRRLAMKGVVGRTQPAFNVDDAHRRRTLDQALAQFGLRDCSDAERETLWRSWHQLDTWAEFVSALARLRRALPVVSFTMLPAALVVHLSRRNGIDWDAINSCEMIGVCKPQPQAYATAARWLALQPAQILMVACHNFDLNAAHAAGFRTAFVRRPDEWGPEGPRDPHPNRAYDLVVDGFDALAEQMPCRLDAVDRD